MTLRAVFLDAGGVITRLKVPKHVVFVEACEELGLALGVEKAREAFASASGLLEEMPDAFLEDYPHFREAYMQRLQQETGVEDRFEDVYRKYMSLLQSTKFRELFDDVVPTLEALRSKGLSLGILSNASRNLIDLFVRFGVVWYFDALIISELVGFEKPQTEIFETALDVLGVSANEALHLGDSYHYDFLGASHAGLQALLLDRALSFPKDVPKISTLRELPSRLEM